MPNAQPVGTAVRVTEAGEPHTSMTGIVVRPTDPCPCLKGATVANCTCRARNFVPKPALTIPPGLTTNKEFAFCYAAPFRDCKGKRSAEHVVSESVLYELVHGNSHVAVSGRTWQRVPYQKIPISGTGSHILCERHNSALSQLDERMRDLFVWLRTVGNAGAIRKARLFNGHDVERWMLKVLVGTLYCESGPVCRQELEAPAFLVAPHLSGYASARRVGPVRQARGT